MTGADVFTATILGVPQVSAYLSRMGAAAANAEYRLVRTYGQLYQTRVRARASGRPGPRVVTGDYRRSITLELTRGPAGTKAEVYSTRPQARRLEYGFMNMTDSLGRTFRQPPYPHWRPDLERTVDELQQALLAAIAAVA